MTDFQLIKTTILDLNFIVSLENENLSFISPNSKKEHIDLIIDKNISHLILKSTNNTLLGFVILAGLENENRSIEFRRIVINKKGKGFGRMAIKKIKKYCFENLNCQRLWLDVLEDNERAKHLYKSEGFQEEGTLRDTVIIDGKFKSLIIMAILHNEYKKHYG
jgi:RimJ/RimL family protein N-acetyltransferase